MFIPSPKYIPQNLKLIKKYPLSIYKNLVMFTLEWKHNELEDIAYGETNVECQLCGWKGHSFYPSFVNNKIRHSNLCPRCFSQPKDRNFLFTINKNGYLIGKPKILDIGPSICIKNYMIKNNYDYEAIDLYPGDPDIKKMDVTDLQYTENTFDVVICLDVLEHVRNDKKALHEMMRVLRKDGIIFLTTPVGNAETTKEYKNVDELESDHVRQYGKDVIALFEQYAGAKVERHDYDEYFDKDNAKRYGLQSGTFFKIHKTNQN